MNIVSEFVILRLSVVFCGRAEAFRTLGGGREFGSLRFRLLELNFERNWDLRSATESTGASFQTLQCWVGDAGDRDWPFRLAARERTGENFVLYHPRFANSLSGLSLDKLPLPVILATVRSDSSPN